MTSMESLLQHMESFKKIIKTFAKKQKLQESLGTEEVSEQTQSADDAVQISADS